MRNDLKDILPQQTKTVKAIFDYHKERGDAEHSRAYLGASSIGRECSRQLWYQFRACSAPDFDGRMYRLFETGDLEEIRFIKELREIGCTAHDVDPSTGQQFEVVGIGGHFKGHMDGAAVGIPEAPKTWHVLEFKTHNAKSFAKLQKEGVEASKPEHHAQMMVYMGLTGMKRSLYLARNKDDDDLYSERIRFDKKEFDRLMEKAESIIRSVNPPERMASRSDDWRCRFCDTKELCWGTGSTVLPLPSVDCRTCCHVTPEIDEGETWGRWSCARTGKDLHKEELCKACPHHLVLPSLLHGWTPIDSSLSGIEFESEDGETHITHGEGEGAWSTEELIRTTPETLWKKKIDTVKKAFNGEIDYIDDLCLFDRYPKGTSERVWHGEEDQLPAGMKYIPEPREITRKEVCGAMDCVEFNGELLLVKYTNHGNHYAIWRGRE